MKAGGECGPRRPGTPTRSPPRPLSSRGVQTGAGTGPRWGPGAGEAGGGPAGRLPEAAGPRRRCPCREGSGSGSAPPGACGAGRGAGVPSVPFPVCVGGAAGQRWAPGLSGCGVAEEQVEGKGKRREQPLKIPRAPPLSVSLIVGRSGERYRGLSCCLRPPQIRQGGLVCYGAALTPVLSSTSKYLHMRNEPVRIGPTAPAQACSTVLRSPAEPGSLLGSFFRKKTK